MECELAEVVELRSESGPSCPAKAAGSVVNDMEDRAVYISEMTNLPLYCD